MADQEEQVASPAVENEAVVEDAAAAPAEGAEGAAPEKKRREPREIGPLLPKPDTVEEPDEAAKDKAIAAIQLKITAWDKRVNDIRELIAKQTASRKEMGDQSGTLRTEKKQVRTQFEELRARRSAIFEELTKQKEARNSAQTKLSEMKKSLKVGSLPEIERRIAAIEYEMSTTSMTLKEEKALMIEIKELKASREKVRTVEAMNGAVSSLATAAADSTKTLQEQIKDLDQEMSALRVREKALHEGLEAMNAKFEKGGPTIPQLLTEQKELYGKIKEERQKIRDLEFKHKHAAYLHRQYKKAFSDWKWQQDQIRYQERQKQYEERKKEREAEEAPEQFVKVPTHPWAEELFIVDDLIKYCKKNALKAAPAASSTSSKKQFDPAVVKAGLIPIGKTVGAEDKEDSEWDWMKGKSGGKGGKGGKKGGAAAASSAAAPAEPKPVEDKKLSLSIDAYSGFFAVGVQPPVMASQCAVTIQELQKAKIRIQRLTAEDKQKQKTEAAAAQKAAKEAKKTSAKASTKEGSSIPTAAVAEPTIDFRKAIKGVHGAHV